jgi:DNA polymerase elongation subunit (family B)
MPVAPQRPSGDVMKESAVGSFASIWHVRVMSAFPSIATEERTSRDVSNVP